MTALSSEHTDKIAPAFVKAQGAMSNVVKDMDGQAGNQKIKFADLATVLEMAKPVLQEHKLAVQWRSLDAPTGVRVQCVVLHESGQWYADEGMRLPARQDNAQQYGSAFTYGKRYTLMGLLGIATEDDDAQAAAQQSSTPAAPAQPAERAPRPLTPAEKRDLEKLAVNAGYPEDKARRSVAKLARDDVAKFRTHCQQQSEANATDAKGAA